MANCYFCNERDGWGRMALDHKGNMVPICARHWKTGCQKCHEYFDHGDRMPVEVRLSDARDEALIYCQECANHV